MSKLVVDDIERTEDYAKFIEQLKTFHSSKGTTLLSEPVLGGKKVDLYKLYQEVIKAGGFDQVTKKRSWKQIGDIFGFAATCTNSAYILKGLYIRNLLGWEEEQVWRNEWIPPDELKGPEAHKASTLAGKTYKKPPKQKAQHHTSVSHEPFILPNHFTAISPHSTAFNSPFNLIPTDEVQQCEISERHHQTQPFEHVHSMEADLDQDCATANEFDESSKAKMLSALQSQIRSDVEWALNQIVTVSYEYPQKLLITENPNLLDILIRIGNTRLKEALFSQADTSTNDHTTLLKILHIIRNFSFIESNARVFTSNPDFKQMLIKCLVMKNSMHYSHCIDILENMTPFVELGPFDSIIGCLNNLLMNASERSVILGSVRILTKLVESSPSNLHYLLPTSSQMANRIAQLLIVSDEELIGASLEYLYQYSSRSISFGQHLLSLQHGANIGILVSLLLAPCKYFRPSFVQPHNSPKRLLSDSIFLEHTHGNFPCDVPNLSMYQQLDEPYRCLGWLKDKFELSGRNTELSLDDMYLLYEMRFGHEKALRIKEFYTVLKIAFPIANGSFEGFPKQGAILEGTTIRGLQVKMCILQDGSELMCQWTDCSQSFNDEHKLQNHILHDHVQSEQVNSNCMWNDCDQDAEFQNMDELSTHIRNSHLPIYTDTSEIQGIALVAAQLLKVLSKNPNSHSYFMPYEQELASMLKRRPKLTPYIESMFSNFSVVTSPDLSLISQLIIKTP